MTKLISYDTSEFCLNKTALISKCPNTIAEAVHMNVQLDLTAVHQQLFTSIVL
jgi:hypothetical protein